MGWTKREAARTEKNKGPRDSQEAYKNALMNLRQSPDKAKRPGEKD